MNSAAPKFADDTVPRFPELSVVRLVHDVAAMDWDGVERMFRAGSAGTVMGIYSVGDAYEVEFSEPFPGLVTLVDHDLTGGTAR